MGKKLKISNCSIIASDKVIENGCILLKDGKIELVSEKNIKAAEYEEIDAKGKYVSPGFIDIHTHGGGGHDFMDNTTEAFLESAKAHALHGTTSLAATTLTSTGEVLETTLKVFDKAKNAAHKGANLIGLHLEGPYFALSQKGAQNPKYIKNPDEKEYKSVIESTDSIIRWSAAPELKGALEFGSYITKHGVLASIAHSDAVYEDIIKAFNCGFTHVTHLYSATSTVKRINAYRYAGIIEAAYLIDDMTVEIIADGSHLPASLLKLVYKIKGPDKIALVTDSMRGAGMPEGESLLGGKKEGQKVMVEDGVAKMPDRKSFAGSVATADRLVRNMINLAGVPLTDAVKMMTSTPAGIIGVANKKGVLKKGYDADLIAFDSNINVSMTIVNGKFAYNNSKDSL